MPVLQAAQADVGEALVVDEQPAVAGEVLAVEVDLHSGAVAAAVAKVGPERHGHHPVLEDIADGARHGRADAVGADDDATSVFDRLASALGRHGGVVGADCDVPDQHLVLEVRAAIDGVHQQDVVEPASVQEDGEVGIDGVGGIAAR